MKEKNSGYTPTTSSNHNDMNGGNNIKINVSYGSNHHQLLVPSHSTFGYVKELIEEITGLERTRLKVLFRGQVKDDGDSLHDSGVKDKSKVLILVSEKSLNAADSGNNVLSTDHNEGIAAGESEEAKAEEEEDQDQTEDMSKAFLAISQVREEVDKLADRVAALGVAVNSGNRVADDEFTVSSELLMRQLLKLDSIEAGGEARLQRKAEVKRVQNYHDMLDNLKARNSNPFVHDTNAVAVTTKWETFDSEVESSIDPPPPVSSSTKITQEWEKFD